MTESQIRAQVEAIRSKDSFSRAVALRSELPWMGAERLIIAGNAHRVVSCRSDLQLRDSLLDAERADEQLVALCQFEDSALGDDVRVRLAKARIFHPMASEALAGLFRIKSKGIDRRILSCQPLVDALIEQAPLEGYPARPSGALDLQTAWTEVLGRALGNRAAVASIEGFLEASLQPALGKVLESLEAALRDAFFEWACLSLGTPFRWMRHLVERGQTMDLVPAGLVMGLVFSESTAMTKELGAAQARLENWFDRATPEPSTSRAWGQASANVVRSLAAHDSGGAPLKSVLARFDQLLAEIKLSDAAMFSDYSPHGLTLRFRRFARIIKESLSPKGVGSHPGSGLEDALQGIASHLLAREHVTQQRKCRMAARLTCWLTSHSGHLIPESLEGRVTHYQQEGAFVDWARTSLEGSEAESELKAAFASLVRRVDQAWLEVEEGFAKRLSEWCQAGSPELSGVLPIEKALKGIIGPVASQAPVLLLVMDGMSVPVFRELLDDLVNRGRWLEASPDNPSPPGALLATIPSITEVSRRALFRGDLSHGTTPTEQSAFRTNDFFHSQSSGQARPELFLKGDLQAAGEFGISAAVQKAIENRRCRVVGVVLNVIDDHLKGSDQFAYEWNLDSIQPLREVLQLAASAGRVVVMTSDHGHVLERETKVGAEVADGGDRHRFGGGPVQEGEVKIVGSRVQQALGRDSVIVPWSRNLRYGPKRQGYHGGVNLQEMVVPFAILHHASTRLPEGWKDVVPSPSQPFWWRLQASDTARLNSTPAALADLTPETRGLDLFVHAASSIRSDEGWVAKLLSSDVYSEQCVRGVRGAPKVEEMALFIETLNARGGSMPSEALAFRLGLPASRLNGHVQNLARILNVDGYEVVNVDFATGTVVLNIALLKQQFQLDT
jgi:hypothetical protein